MIINKSQTKEGSLYCPNRLHSDWTSDFSDFPNFTYCDMYTYLINKEGYNHESLKGPQSIQVVRKLPSVLGWPCVNIDEEHELVQWKSLREIWSKANGTRENASRTETHLR